MRKKIYPVLFVAALSLSACTEVLEPNVDYGGNTFINDYSSLVEAVNNLNKTLQERFEALNTLLNSNLANIKVAIDENTGAIKVLDQNNQQGLKDINTAIFDGFKTLSEQVDAQGQAIVYAVNQNGELLRLQIDTTGKLVSSQILDSTNAIVKAINDQTKSLEERFAALDATVKAGLLDVYVSIDKNTSAITLMDKNMQTSLATVDASLTKGFKALKESVDEQGNAIVGAVNTQGKLLVAQIDSTGKLISAQIEGSVESLISTLNDNNKALTDKIEALNTALASGLADVKCSIDTLTAKVELQTEAIAKLDGTLASGMSDLKTGLNTINTTIGQGFAAVGKDLTKAGGMIVKAINHQSKELTLAIDKNGRMISASICKLNFDTNVSLAWLIAYQRQLNNTLEKINANLDKLSSAEISSAETLKKILESINKMLGDKGIYYVSGRLYMTDAAWSLVSGDKCSDLYKNAQAQARMVCVKVKTTYDACKIVVRSSTIAEDKDALYAVNYKSVEGIGTDAKVYEIVKMKDGIVGTYFSAGGTLRLNHKGCSYYKVGYSYTDAKGSHSEQANAEGKQFTVAYVSDGILVETIEVELFAK